MTELRPLLECSESPTARDLLRAGLGDAPPPDAAGRVAAALGLTVTAVAIAAPASAAALNGAVAGGLSAASKASGASGLLLGKWLVSGLAAGALVSGTASVVEHVRARSEANVHVAVPAPSVTPERRAPVKAGTAPLKAEPVAGPTTELDAPPTRSKDTLASPPSAASNAPSAPESSASRALGAEAARIDAARQALGRGDVRRALIELDWYERSRAVGVLDREAELLRIQALVRAGEGARAVELARAYLAKHPHDAYAPRLTELIRGGGANFPLSE